MGPIHDALELPMCKCNLGDILEQCALCKGMSRLTTHDMWPRQTGLLVRGKGMDCDVDPLDCKIGSVVILINLDGAKTIIERFKGQDWDQVDLVEPFGMRIFPGFQELEFQELELQECVLVETVVTVDASEFLSGSISFSHSWAMLERKLEAPQDMSSSHDFLLDLTFFASWSPR